MVLWYCRSSFQRIHRPQYRVSKFYNIIYTQLKAFPFFFSFHYTIVYCIYRPTCKWNTENIVTNFIGPIRAYVPWEYLTFSMFITLLLFALQTGYIFYFNIAESIINYESIFPASLVKKIMANFISSVSFSLPDVRKLGLVN